MSLFIDNSSMTSAMMPIVTPESVPGVPLFGNGIAGDDFALDADQHKIEGL